MGSSIGLCGRESEPSLEEANLTLDVQVQNLENRIAKMAKDAQSWAAQAQSEPTAKMRCMACLKKKKQYEAQRDRLLATQCNIESAQFQQEQTQIAFKAAQALRKGHERMKEQQEKMNVDQLEQLMDDFQDRQAALQESQEVMARSGALDGVPDADFESEFRVLVMEASATNEVVAPAFAPTQRQAQSSRQAQPELMLAESSQPRYQSHESSARNVQKSAPLPSPPSTQPKQQRQPHNENLPAEASKRRPPKESEVAPSLLQGQAEEKRSRRRQQAEQERFQMEARAQEWAAAALPLNVPRLGLRQPVLVA